MNTAPKNQHDDKRHHSATYVRCPYNRRHYVLERIYDSHLNDCSRENPHINVLICPFNGSHRCRNITAMVN